MAKNLPAKAGDTGYMNSIIDGEDPMEEDMATHASILAWQAPLSMGFPRQEYWRGLPYPPP